MASPPDYRLYPSSGQTDRDIGAAWKNRDGEGYGLSLNHLPASGLLAMRHAGLENDDPELWVFDEDERSLAFYLYETVKRPDERDASWTRIGRAYRHQDAHGFAVIIDLWPDIRDPDRGVTLRTPKESRKPAQPARSEKATAATATRGQTRAGGRTSGRR
jgi:hypothetical protein